MFFPESGIVNGIGPYDTARGFLHTDRLRWSWGGVIGTDADWVAGATQGDTDEMLDRAVAMGFRGLVLDRRGYPNGLASSPSPRPRATRGSRAPTTRSSSTTCATTRQARARLGAEGLRAKRAEALRDHGQPRAIG